MRRGMLAAAAALLTAVFLSFSPAQAMPISAPAALKGASDTLTLTDQVHCGYYRCGGCGWGGCYYRSYYRPYYRPYGYYRPYRPYYGYGYYRPYRPYYGYGYYRPYYRPYYGYGYYRPYRPYYGYGYYRPYYRPYYSYYRPVPPWVSGPYYY